MISFKILHFKKFRHHSQTKLQIELNIFHKIKFKKSLSQLELFQILKIIFLFSENIYAIAWTTIRSIDGNYYILVGGGF